METTKKSSVLRTAPLTMPWQTFDPFLVCMHHDDMYPAGNETLGPNASLAGRDIGQDFSGRDGWSMYHGDEVPGFPQHPHRGFETVTIVRRGLVDHADSAGATARYGEGDVQWLTAGRGILHSEMFPLLDRSKENRLELFQLWLNLPRAKKLVAPNFSMLWASDQPRIEKRDDAGRTTTVTVIAGAFGEVQPPAPPPDSWASDPRSDLAIWTARLDAGASLVLPPAKPGSLRSLYFFAGSSLRIGETNVPAKQRIDVVADAELHVEAGVSEVEFVVLQGRPIGEPVVSAGPFVMNTREEIQETFLEYRRTQFGGWPWPNDAPVHTRDTGRFAKRGDAVDRPRE